MHLYLVQHGDALAKTEDAMRPLSGKGRQDISRLASFLARSRLPISVVLHSGKLRAQQTALIFADVLGPGRIVQDCPCAIAPNDPVTPLVNALKGELRRDDGLMIVGHLPFMDKLVSSLLLGPEDRSCVDFETGTVVALSGEPAAADWRLDWVMKPKLLTG
ncbi:MAG: phosphohistidine phosphatase SixA [Rhodospirillales bacterium]|nr:phosphohistidine phosphatase SixA [Rhodospirillales bacterium]